MSEKDTERIHSKPHARQKSDIHTPTVSHRLDRQKEKRKSPDSTGGIAQTCSANDCIRRWRAAMNDRAARAVTGLSDPPSTGIMHSSGQAMPSLSAFPIVAETLRTLGIREDQIIWRRNDDDDHQENTAFDNAVACTILMGGPFLLGIGLTAMFLNGPAIVAIIGVVVGGIWTILAIGTSMKS